MWQQILALVSRVLAPFYNSTTGKGEILIAVSSTHSVIKIPDWLLGHYGEFTSYGAASQILFGTSTSVEVTYGQASSVDGTTKVVTVNSKTGRHIPDGATRSYLVPRDATYMAVEASGTGVLQIGPSSKRIE